MKRVILVLLLFIGLGFSTSAQVHGRGNGGKGTVRTYVRPPRVAIIGGYGFSPYAGLYNPYNGYGFGYNPYFYNPGMYRSYRPSKLDLQIEDIRNDYNDMIRSARRDKELPRKERRAKVQELKHEREKVIIEAKRNYYKSDIKA